MTTTRALAIINPNTGRTPVQDIVSDLLAEAELRKVDLSVELTCHPNHAIELTEGAVGNVDVLIAVGGDGTVSDVVTGSLETDIPIGIIPTGSTNIIARGLGIPRDITRAIQVALGPSDVVEMDVARAGETTFLHMAGAGFDARIMRDTPSVWKRRIGWIAYLPAALNALRAEPFQLSLNVDGEEHSALARLVLFAVGGEIIMPQLRVGSGIDPTDGLLDVLVYDPPGILQTVSCMGWLLLGKSYRSKWIRQYRGRTVLIETEDTVPFEVDGDFWEHLPEEITMLDQKAIFYVPSQATVIRARH